MGRSWFYLTLLSCLWWMPTDAAVNISVLSISLANGSVVHDPSALLAGTSCDGRLLMAKDASTILQLTTDDSPAPTAFILSFNGAEVNVTAAGFNTTYEVPYPWTSTYTTIVVRSSSSNNTYDIQPIMTVFSPSFGPYEDHVLVNKTANMSHWSHTNPPIHQLDTEACIGGSLGFDDIDFMIANHDVDNDTNPISFIVVHPLPGPHCPSIVYQNILLPETYIDCQSYTYVVEDAAGVFVTGWFDLPNGTVMEMTPRNCNSPNDFILSRSANSYSFSSQKGIVDQYSLTFHTGWEPPYVSYNPTYYEVNETHAYPNYSYNVTAVPLLDKQFSSGVLQAGLHPYSYLDTVGNVTSNVSYHAISMDTMNTVIGADFNRTEGLLGDTMWIDLVGPSSSLSRSDFLDCIYGKGHVVFQHTSGLEMIITNMQSFPVNFTLPWIGNYSVFLSYENEFNTWTNVSINQTLIVWDTLENLTISFDGYLNSNGSLTPYPTLSGSCPQAYARDSDNYITVGIAKGYSPLFALTIDNTSYTELPSFRNATFVIDGCHTVSNQCSKLVGEAVSPSFPTVLPLNESISLTPALANPGVYATHDYHTVLVNTSLTIGLGLYPDFISALDLGGCGQGKWNLSVGTDIYGDFTTPSTTVLFDTLGSFATTITYTNAFTSVSNANLTVTVLEQISNLTLDLISYSHLSTDYALADPHNSSCGFPVARNKNNTVIIAVKTGIPAAFRVQFETLDNHTQLNNTQNVTLNAGTCDVFTFNCSRIVATADAPDNSILQSLSIAKYVLPLVVFPTVTLTPNDSVIARLSNVAFAISSAPTFTDFDLGGCGQGAFEVLVNGTSVLQAVTTPNFTLNFNASGVFSVAARYTNTIFDGTEASVNVIVIDRLEGLSIQIDEFKRLDDNTTIALKSGAVMNCTVTGEPFVPRDAKTLATITIESGSCLLPAGLPFSAKMKTFIGEPSYYSLIWNNLIANDSAVTPSMSRLIEQPFNNTDNPSVSVIAAPLVPVVDEIQFNISVVPILIQPIVNVTASPTVVQTGEFVNITIEIGNWFPFFDESACAMFFWDLYIDQYVVLPVLTSTWAMVQLNSTGTFNLNAVFENALTRIIVNTSNTVTAVAPLVDFTVSVDEYRTLLDNSTINVKSGSSTNCSLTSQPFIARDAQTMLTVMIASGDAAYYALSWNVDTWLNTTAVTSAVQILIEDPFNITHDPTIIARAVPVNPIVKEIGFNITVVPILVDPMITLVATPNYVLAGSTVNISIEIANWNPTFDESACSNFSWTLYIGSNRKVGPMTSRAVNVQFNATGNYSLDAHFENALIEHVINSSTTVTVVAPLDDFTVTVDEYRTLETNTTVTLKPGANINCTDSSQPFIARDAQTMITLAVASGEAAYFALSWNADTWRNTTAVTPSMQILIEDPFNVTHDPTIIARAVPVDSIVNELGFNLTIIPILVDPMISVTATPSHVLEGSTVNISIEISNWNPIFDESMCANFSWTLYVGDGQSIGPVTSRTVQTQLNTTGNFSLDLRFENALIERIVNSSAAILVEENLANITVTVVELALSGIPVQLKNGVQLSNATHLYMGRDVDTTLFVELRKGLPGSYDFTKNSQVTSFNSSLTRFNWTDYYPWGLQPQLPFESNWLSVSANPPSSLLPFSTPTVNMSIIPIIVNPVFSINVSQLEVFVNTAINVSLSVNDWMVGIDDHATAEFSWSLFTDDLSLAPLMNLDQQLTFNRTGTFAINVNFDNVLVNRWLNQSVNITVVEQLKNLSTVVLSYERSGVVLNATQTIFPPSSCGKLIARDAKTILEGTVAQGRPAEYLFYYDGNAYSNQSNNQNITYYLNEYSGSYAPQPYYNLTVTPSDNINSWLYDVTPFTPVLVQPSLNLSALSPTSIAPQDTINFTLSSDPPFIQDLDFSNCSLANWDLVAVGTGGPSAFSLTTTSVVLQFNSSGSYLMQATYHGVFGDIVLPLSIAVTVGSVSNLRVTVVQYEFSNGTVLSVSDNTDVNETCHPLLARDQFTRVKTQVDTSAPSYVESFTVLYNGTRFTANSTNASANFALPPYHSGYVSLNQSRMVVSQTATSTDFPTLLSVQPFVPVLLSPILALNVTSTVALTNSNVNVSLTSVPALFPELDLDDCVQGQWTLDLGNGNITNHSSAFFAEASWQNDGTYSLTAFYSNRLRSTSVTTPVAITVTSSLASLDVLVTYTLNNGTQGTSVYNDNCTAFAVPRGVQTVTKVKLSQGVPQSYKIKIGSVVHDIGINNTWNSAVYNEANVTHLFFNTSKISITAQAVPLYSIAGSLLETRAVVATIAYDPLITFTLSKTVMFVGQTTIMALDTSSLSTYDASPCADGVLRAQISNQLAEHNDASMRLNQLFTLTTPGVHQSSVVYTNRWGSWETPNPPNVTVVDWLSGVDFNVSVLTTWGASVPPVIVNDTQCPLPMIARNQLNTFMVTYQAGHPDTYNMRYESGTAFAIENTTAAAPFSLFKQNFSSFEDNEGVTVNLTVFSKYAGDNETMNAVTRAYEIIAGVLSLSLNTSTGQFVFYQNETANFQAHGLTPSDLRSCAGSKLILEFNSTAGRNESFFDTNTTLDVHLSEYGDFSLSLHFSNHFCQLTFADLLRITVLAPLNESTLQILSPATTKSGANVTLQVQDAVKRLFSHRHVSFSELSFTFIYDDGTTIATSKPVDVHVFYQPGNHSITVLATDNQTTISSTFSIIVYCQPLEHTLHLVSTYKTTTIWQNSTELFFTDFDPAFDDIPRLAMTDTSSTIWIATTYDQSVAACNGTYVQNGDNEHTLILTNVDESTANQTCSSLMWPASSDLSEISNPLSEKDKQLLEGAIQSSGFTGNAISIRVAGGQMVAGNRLFQGNFSYQIVNALTAAVSRFWKFTDPVSASPSATMFMLCNRKVSATTSRHLFTEIGTSNVTLAVQSPFNTTFTSGDESNFTNIWVVIEDNTSVFIGIPVTSVFAVSTRSMSTTAPVLKAPETSTLLQTVTVTMLTPYADYRQIYVEFWAESPSNVMTLFGVGTTDNETHAAMDIVLSELGEWTVWVQVYTGVSSVSSSKYTILVCCETKNVTIATALFSYKNQNGSEPLQWARADWKHSYTNVPTVEALQPSVFYLQASYQGSMHCSRSWLQVDTKEMSIINSLSNVTQAEKNCALMNASLSTVPATSNDSLAFLTLLLNEESCASAWLATQQVIYENGSWSTAPSQELHCGICVRSVCGGQFLISLQNPASTSLMVQSPFTLTLPDSNADSSEYSYNALVTDVIMLNSGRPSNSSVSIYARLPFPTPLSINTPTFAVFNEPTVVALADPYSNWHDTIEILFQWELPSVVSTVSARTNTKDDPISVNRSITFSNLGTWVIQSSVANSVDDIWSANSTITVVCQPQSHSVVQGFFSYGKLLENGSQPEDWTASDWIKWWTSQDLTFKHNDNAALYIATTYGGTSGPCAGSWVQHKSVEYFLPADTQNEAGSIASCEVFGSKLAGYYAHPLADKQAMRVLLTKMESTPVSHARYDAGLQVDLNGEITPMAASYATRYICARSIIKNHNFSVTIHGLKTVSESPIVTSVAGVNSTSDQETITLAIQDESLAFSGLDMPSTTDIVVRKLLVISPTFYLPSTFLFGYNVTATVLSPYSTWYYPLMFQWTWWYESDLTSVDVYTAVEQKVMHLPLNRIGFWRVTLTVFNGVDHVTSASKRIEILPLSDLHLYAMYPYNGDILNMQHPEFDDRNDMNFTLAYYDTTYQISYTNGSVQHHRIRIYNATDNVQYADFSINGTLFKFTTPPGQWIVSVCELESPFKWARNITIRSIEKIPPLTLVPVGNILNTQEQLQFRFDFDAPKSLFDCMVVDWDDGGGKTRLGNPNHCANWTDWNAANFDGPTSYISGDYVTHTYLTPGARDIKIKMNNFVSIESTSLLVDIKNSSCYRPRVEFLDSSSSIFTPRSMECGSAKTFTMQVSLNCTYTDKVTREWRIEKIDPVTATSEYEADLIGQLGDAVNSYGALTIPARFICYGLIRVYFKIRMDEAALSEAGAPAMGEISTETIGYFNVMPSDIMAKLIDGISSIATLGTDEGQTLSTDAGKYSLNPNTDTTNTSLKFDRYQYVCRVSGTGEVWPMSTDFSEYLLSNVTEPVSVFNLPSTPNGCFGGGSLLCYTGQRLKFFRCSGPGALANEASFYDVHGHWFAFNYSYDFGVRIWKHYDVDGIIVSKTSDAFVRLDIVPGTPPKIKVTCETNSYCAAESDGVRVTHTQDTNFRCICENCDTMDPLIYSWSIKKYISFAETMLTIDHIVKEPTWVEGMSTQVLTLKKAFWNANPHINMYDLQCKITKVSNGLSASTLTNIRANKPPADPVCNVVPMNGTELLTQYTMSCAGWSDQDDGTTALQYTYSYKTAAGAETVIGTTGLASAKAYLPAGTYTFIVTATDPYFAQSVPIKVPNVMAVSVPPAHLDPTVAIDNAVSSGDTATVLSAVTAVSQTTTVTTTPKQEAINEEYSDQDDPSPFVTKLSKVSGVKYDADGNLVDPFDSPQILDRQMQGVDYDYAEYAAAFPSGQDQLQDLGLDVENLLLLSSLEDSLTNPKILTLGSDEATSSAYVKIVEPADSAAIVLQLETTINTDGTVNALGLNSIMKLNGLEQAKAGEARAHLFTQEHTEDEFRDNLMSDGSETRSSLLGLIQIGPGADDQAVSTSSMLGSPPSLISPMLTKAIESNDFRGIHVKDKQKLRTQFSCPAEFGQIASLTEDQQQAILAGQDITIPTLKLAGTVLMNMPDATARSVDVRKDTVAMKSVKMEDKVIGSVGYVPVQVSSTGVTTVAPQHLYDKTGRSIHAGIPGAPAYVSSPIVQESLNQLDVIIIPMSVQGCDSLKAECDDKSKHTLAREACLRLVQKQLDVMNDAYSTVSTSMVNALGTVQIKPENVLSLASALETVATNAMITTVDPKSGSVQPQTLLSVDSAAKTGDLLADAAEMLLSPEIFDSISPDRAAELSESLMKSMTSITNAQILSRTMPLAADKKIALENEVRSYETVLHIDYDKSRRVDEMTEDDWADIAAIDKADRLAKITSERFKKVTRAIEKLAFRDVALLERGQVAAKEFHAGGSCYSLKVGRLQDVIAKAVGNLFSCGYTVKLPTQPCDLVTSSSCDGKRIVILKAMYFGNNYRQMEASKTASTSTGLLDLSLNDVHNDPIAVSNSKKPITVVFRSTNKKLPKVHNVVPVLDDLIKTNQYFSLHQVVIDRQNASVLVQIRPTDATMDLMLFFAKRYPGPMSDQNSDLVAVGKLSDIPGKLRFNWMIRPDVIGGHTGDAYVAVARRMPHGTYADGNITVKWGSYVFSRNFSTGYRFRTITKGCYYLDEFADTWVSNGLQPLSEASPRYVRCSTTHLTAFSAGLFVAPNSIDFNYVLDNAHFENNLSIYVALLVCYACYILLFIWSKWKDRLDINKVRSLPLADNDPSDRQVYEVVVRTGYGNNAATDSKVSIVITGEHAETQIRDLTCDLNRRKTFRNGGIDSFVLTTRNVLGHLRYIRIWHDNSGKSDFRGWYCSYVTIIDCQTGIRYPFLVERWLAVDEEDGMIERFVPMATKLELAQFKTVVSQDSRLNVTDRHIWFSMFARPPQSRFLRVERLTCIFSVVLMSLLFSAMWYGVIPEDPASYFKMGPFILGMEQIGVGLLSNILTLPFNLLIIHLFRKAKLRRKRPNHVVEALRQAELPLLPIKKDDYNATTAAEQRRRQSEGWLLRAIRTELPWWLRLIAWLLCFVSVVISTAFIVFYGIEFGDAKARKWLASVVTAIVTSIFLTHPIKLLFLSIICMCVYSRHSVLEDENLDSNEEQLLYKEPDFEDLPDDDELTHVTHQPVLDDSLDEDREERLQERRMFDLIYQIVITLSFALVVFIIAYGSRDVMSFHYVDLTKKFYLGAWNFPENQFQNIRTTDDFYNYARNTLVNSTRAFWYEGSSPIDMRGMVMDKYSRMLGYAIIRQIRQQDSNECKVQDKLKHLIARCKPESSLENEDHKSYSSAWQPLGVGIDREIEYLYTEPEALKSFPITGRRHTYGGGGYILPMFNLSYDVIPRLDQLQKDAWIDNRTKGVLIEFCNYNAQINMFMSATLMLEVTAAGAFLPRWNFHPIRLYRYLDNFGPMLMFFEGIFFCYVIFFFIMEMRQLRREGCVSYFTEIWTLIDLGIVFCAIGETVFYLLRLWATNDVSSDIVETAGNVYVKLQLAEIYDAYFSYFQALCLFFANVKVLQLLKFNPSMSRVMDTIHESMREVVAFAVVFFVVYSAFCGAFFILLSDKLYDFSTYLLVNEEAFASMLGKFSFRTIIDASELAPWFVFVFMVMQAMILLNMLIAIITNVFTDIKTDADRQHVKYEIVEMLSNKMRALFGLEQTEGRFRTFEDLRTNNLYVPHFAQRFDLFLRKLNKSLDGSLDLVQLHQKASKISAMDRELTQERMQVARQRYETRRRGGKPVKPTQELSKPSTEVVGRLIKGVKKKEKQRVMRRQKK